MLHFAIGCEIVLRVSGRPFRNDVEKQGSPLSTLYNERECDPKAPGKDVAQRYMQALKVKAPQQATMASQLDGLWGASVSGKYSSSFCRPSIA